MIEICLTVNQNVELIQKNITDYVFAFVALGVCFRKLHIDPNNNC